MRAHAQAHTHTHININTHAHLPAAAQRQPAPLQCASAPQGVVQCHTAPTCEQTVRKTGWLAKRVSNCRSVGFGFMSIQCKTIRDVSNSMFV